MTFLTPLNIPRLLSRRDVDGLIKALTYRKPPAAVVHIASFVRRIPKEAFDTHVVRGRAAKALGEIGDLSAIEPLVKMLQQYEDPFVRKETVVALGQIGGLRVFQVLIDLLQAAGEKESLYFPAWYDPVYCENIVTAVVDALIQYNSAAVDPLIDLLGGSHNDMQRRAIVRVLAKVGDERALESLLLLLQDSDQVTRRWAVTGLGKLADVRAVEPLMTALKDSDSVVRENAAEALGLLGDPRAIDALLTLRKDPDMLVRDTVKEALHQLGRPLSRKRKSLNTLLKELESDDWTWDSAAQLLPMIDTIEVTGLLKIWDKANTIVHSGRHSREVQANAKRLRISILQQRPDIKHLLSGDTSIIL